MKNNTIEKVYQLLQEAGAGGKIFSVTFTKKDGSSRAMNCRTGVKKHLTGGMLKYDPISRGLLPVYDLKKRPIA